MIARIQCTNHENASGVIKLVGVDCLITGSIYYLGMLMSTVTNYHLGILEKSTKH